ncbi:DUF4397 domain-containing protein [Chitinophaga sp. 22321]|uniref:DUF4397 domain-containing protein n=1 Tax=Chitinophaga hostae TaxID=2831022 RepID=A0ABS5IXE2_9BACT|nr:DUF4397 domain-containing protein [Chitinophaga hostae]MBS0027441.1 DUF4397 domain-containing protein [Chitinophaga hostae]
MLTKKNRVWAVVALLTGVIGFSSCLKNDSNITPQRPMAQIIIKNASTTALSVAPIFYDNDQKISDSTIKFDFIARYSVYGGPHKFDLKKKGADSLISTTGIYNIDSTQYYTYLTWGTNPVVSALIKTDQTNYTTSKIGIRFLNLSANAGPVDVYIGSENGEKIDSNRTPFTQSQIGGASTFQLFSNFSINNQITITEAGTKTKIANISLSSQTSGVTSFVPGNFYTIYLAGTKGSNGADKPVVNAFYSLY